MRCTRRLLSTPVSRRLPLRLAVRNQLTRRMDRRGKPTRRAPSR